jgi:hypothetical protein
MPAVLLLPSEEVLRAAAVRRLVGLLALTLAGTGPAACSSPGEVPPDRGGGDTQPGPPDGPPDGSTDAPDAGTAPACRDYAFVVPGESCPASDCQAVSCECPDGTPR